MEVKNLISPSSLAFFSKLDKGEPFVMVNLLKFKPNDEYEDKSNPLYSGEKAFRHYLNAVKDPLLKKVGRSFNIARYLGC